MQIRRLLLKYMKYYFQSNILVASKKAMLNRLSSSPLINYSSFGFMAYHQYKFEWQYKNILLCVYWILIFFEWYLMMINFMFDLYSRGELLNLMWWKYVSFKNVSYFHIKFILITALNCNSIFYYYIHMLLTITSIK